MAGITQGLERLLRRGQEFITNGQLDPEAAAELEKYGYDAARWAEGQTLLDDLQQKAQANQLAYAAQLGATDALQAAFDRAWEQARALARLCAVLLAGQSEALRLLGLHKRRRPGTGESEVSWPRSRNLAHFIPWAQNLYAAAQGNATIAALLAAYGYPAERLSREAADVEALVQASNEREVARAQAQQSTVERDEAVEALRDWLNTGRTIARLALKDNRRLLEVVGLRTRWR